MNRTAVGLCRPSTRRRDKSLALTKFRQFGAYDEATVFSWMAGSSPAMTEKQKPNPTRPAS